ncbi:MAG: glycosyltransferase family 4 protein, partial [Ferruginibacter sp.]|nr:glycosyltransferase family 4 protein [Ferruginibacter sp.]
MLNGTLLLTLRIFSATGGIEKVSRIAGMALYQLQQENKLDRVKILSMYDDSADVDEKYFPATIFSGYRQHKTRFVINALKQGMNSRLVIMSHVNLLLAGSLVKLFSPATKLVLLAHGIEVWGAMPHWKKYLLRKCDQVVAVSRFTKETMMRCYGLREEKFTVLNNCLDPFLPLPAGAPGPGNSLLKRYGLTASNKVLMTLTRLSTKERYKGYDNVFYAISDLKERYPSLKYLVVGKYDAAEMKRLSNIIHVLQLQEQVIFTGFIGDAEIAAHFSIADLYIMPSKKEGFGIVFIEALYYGKPVIAGNIDGSVDALDGGNFGLLINPDNRDEIRDAISKVLDNEAAYVPTHVR